MAYNSNSGRSNFNSRPGAAPYRSQPSHTDDRAKMLKCEEIPEDYLDLAQTRMADHSASGSKLTTSKIRGFLSMITAVYNAEIARVGEDMLLPQSVAQVQMIRVRIAYEVGRDTNGVIEKFVRNTHLLNYLGSVGEKREQFIRFARYMEALVAYHRFYGGKD